MVDWEYSNLNLSRVYFSAFRPVNGTPLENAEPCSLVRQQLHEVGGWVKRAKPFIEVGGKRQAMLDEF
jgi:predicted DNA-binding helix-hairpin-helix protein